MIEGTESKMIYDELHGVIRRWQKEGDKLSAFAVIGALEAVKCDYMEALKRYNDQTPPPVDNDHVADGCEPFGS